MGILTDDMKRVVRQQRFGFIATVCPDGTPNLSPKGTTAVWDDDHLVFGDLASPTTMANLRQNPAMELNVVDVYSRKGYRFKGTVRIVEKDEALFGEIHEAFDTGTRGGPQGPDSGAVIRAAERGAGAAADLPRLHAGDDREGNQGAVGRLLGGRARQPDGGPGVRGVADAPTDTPAPFAFLTCRLRQSARPHHSDPCPRHSDPELPESS